MNITVKKLKTYVIEINEDEAQNLLDFICSLDSILASTNFVSPNQSQKETLNNLGQAFLIAGLKQTKKDST